MSGPDNLITHDMDRQLILMYQQDSSVTERNGGLALNSNYKVHHGAKRPRGVGAIRPYGIFPMSMITKILVKSIYLGEL